MLSQLFSDPISLVFWIIALLIAIGVHEFAHALAADKLGDPTPRIDGRLTLNPLAHLDPIGTLALLIFHIGWGKPVIIDPFNLKNPRKDSAIISLAGPASNFLTALLVALLLRIPGVIQIPFILPFSFSLLSLSIGLGVFNLLPIPPLDGSKILLGILPPRQAQQWEQSLNQYGLIILIFLLLPFFGGEPLIGIIIWPIINFILNLALPGSLFSLPSS